VTRIEREAGHPRAGHWDTLPAASQVWNCPFWRGFVEDIN
jgi:hypothetical protein